MKYDINNIPEELFEIAPKDKNIHDKKLETKPIGFFKDALIRFKKDKSSVLGAIIVFLLLIFAVLGPYAYHQNYIDSYETDYEIRFYQYLLPKLSFMEGTGVWDGTVEKEISEADYVKYNAIEIETGRKPIQKVLEVKENYDMETDKTYRTYVVRLSTYYCVKPLVKTLTASEYEKFQAWQNETGIQLILPWVDYYDKNSPATTKTGSSKVKKNDTNIWYECSENSYPSYDSNGQLVNGYRKSGLDSYNSIRIDSDPGKDDPTATNRYRYASITGSMKNGGYSYTVRIDMFNYFIYKFGYEPCFTFGTNADGYDILTRLASGARFSLLFALAISAINLVIGAIYGAIEGYYGGVTDMVMERISDLLSAIPGMVVTVLFQLHLGGTVGQVVALLFSFILTGWIGMASRTRMQFYRFKNQEYVLAARTLGAKDWRIMFKHIFPNSLGTIITGSVLAIPGVIFGETSLTYLGIVNLDSPTRSSVGAMLSAGQSVMTKYPHVVFFPALFIGLLMIAFNMFGNGLRDAFNPSLRGVEE